MRSRRARPGFAIAAALLLAGCTPLASDAAPSAAPTDDPHTSVDVALAVSTVRPDVVPLAGISGELAVTPEGCYGLGNSGTVQLVVFPIGTTATPGGLDIPGLGEVALGERIEGGGGNFPFSRDYSDVIIPAQCTGDSITYLNPFD